MNPTGVNDKFSDESLLEAIPEHLLGVSAATTSLAGTSAAAPTMQQGKGLKRKKGSVSRKPSPVKKGIRKQNATAEATANDDNEAVRAGVVISAPSHTKQRKLWSPVWKHFKRVTRVEQGTEVVEAICEICEKVFDGSSRNITTRLNNHLEICAKGRNVVFDQERCRRDLARMIIKRQYPLNNVEHEFFKTVSNSFQPTLELPSPENMAEIIHIYQKGKEELRKYLRKLSCGFSLAIDLSKDDLKKSYYIWFTLRFIDDDWELKEKILAVKKLEYKFDKKAFCRTFESVISSWKIKGKFSPVTLNNICDDTDNIMLSYLHSIRLFHGLPILMEGKLIGCWKEIGDLNLGLTYILDPRFKTNHLASQSQPIYGSLPESLFHRLDDSGVFQNSYRCRRRDPSNPAALLGTLEWSEYHRYLAEPTEPFNDKFDILGWWRTNTPNFPTLARMARDFLAARMPNILSNSALGTEITRINQASNDLDPEFVEALICVHDWMETPKR